MLSPWFSYLRDVRKHLNPGLGPELLASRGFHPEVPCQAALLASAVYEANREGCLL